jgi:hypothetical protein
MDTEKTTLSFVTEVGCIGSMNIKDPTVHPVDPLQDLANETKDPALKKYLMENMNKTR